MTSSHLRFVANRLDRVLGGHDLAIGRREVTSASVADRSMKRGPFTGGIRRRLEVEARGEVEMFVVNDVDGVMGRVSAWASEPGSDG